MLPVVWTDRAREDLAEALDYLEERSRAAAERFAEAVNDRCGLLGQFPLMGSPREDLAAGLRCFVIKHYVLFYRVTETAVQAVRLLHGSRDIDVMMRAEDDE